MVVVRCLRTNGQIHCIKKDRKKEAKKIVNTKKKAAKIKTIM